MTETLSPDTGASTATASGRRPPLRFARFRDLALVPAIVILLVVGALLDPTFLTTGNLLGVLQQQSALSLLVLAEAMILITGKFDLSLESTIGFAPVLAIALVVPASAHGLGTEWAAWLAVPLCLLTGALIGAFNGLLILKFQLSAFIVTLGMLITVRGLHEGVSGGNSLFQIPQSFMYLGFETWLGLPLSVWISLALFAIGIVALSYFRQGRSLYAVGGNVDAAKAAGIRTNKVIWTVLIIGGVLAALAGMLETGRLGAIGANLGDGMIFDVFAAAVIGGISLNGGKGTLFGALCGVLVLGLILNILRLTAVDGHWFNAIKGVIILLALVLSRLTTGKAQE
ncbi:ABC transporter permease [Kibdelosporangium phytohabitans]|uniref:ATPase n=1 Tax=Kibdelosporangium phytohabitans TaxID=860235 RepID=A0A0N7F4H8_9PSEU|nr:ABC transporter permease [Kibdelosporangium phytohabitans]ALG11471.1 ATPase [Kibdelosporangium phytohabitans]MBE1462818.1 simple sugar transport system permease protein/ribose transport system permease protein [Kibdelosporangium phytohabitans]